jgi:hypothetical protein
MVSALGQAIQYSLAQEVHAHIELKFPAIEQR